MDNPGPSRQRLPLDFSQSEYGSNTPHGPASNSTSQYRRSSCEFEPDTPINMSSFFQQRPSGVSYSSSREAPPWSEVGNSATPREAYSSMVGLSEQHCPVRLTGRPRLEKGVSKSLDLGLNPGPSSTLSRRQSLGDTPDLTRSKLYDPYKSVTDEKMPARYSQTGPSFINNENNTRGIDCRATATEFRAQERYSSNLSACMYPPSQQSTTADHTSFESRPSFRHNEQQQPNVAPVLVYSENCQYMLTKMKTEPLDPAYPNIPDYHANRRHQNLPTNIPGGSSFNSESTYDALYRQASRSDVGQGHGFDTRRKARTYHRLASTSSRDDSEDPTSALG